MAEEEKGVEKREGRGGGGEEAEDGFVDDGR